jgi:predicted Rossmann fold flavoprotein
VSLSPYEIAIIGGGAAGLTAAIFAKRAAPGARIVVFDGAPKIGAKILISGGGRCNVTHDVVTPDDFNGNRNAIAKVLRTFTVGETVAWFESMGVKLKREETGKLFPITDRARTVVDALLRESPEILAGHRVEAIELDGRWQMADGTTNRHLPSAIRHPVFTMHTNQGIVRAGRVILATGGRSVPKTGSDGHGYAVARSLGHTVTPVFPALVPLIVEEGHWITTLSGTSCDVELSVVAGKVIARERGSMLFTHFGISGPVALDISRHWIAAKGSQLVANFLPGETFESLDRAILADGRRVLRRLPDRLANVLWPSEQRKLTKEERRRIVRALVEHPIPIVRDRGFDYAEVTAGGVPLSEIDLATMQSRKCDGLFLCGEILDVDGKIGGYNFQWAWASGRLAGLSAAGI